MLPVAFANVNPAQLLRDKLSTRYAILGDEIPDVGIFVGAIAANATLNVCPKIFTISVFFIVRGFGHVAIGEKMFALSPQSAFIPSFQKQFKITGSQNLPLEYLEFELVVTLQEAMDLEATSHILPYTIEYVHCMTYTEDIKSDKSVNRTLVGHNIIPRFCMGSVESTGFDEVRVHSHPILEQLFFGLENNHCVITAGNDEFPFGASVLCHIPLGCDHGVTVAPGHKLHYLWIDVFKDREGVDYIGKMHLHSPIWD